ncbi:hypothetical protein QJQ45_014581 [Haematococcus lacustris]|nr:hypothetical protein QJQ45_014581 [Haematococcus lacustris]
MREAGSSLPTLGTDTFRHTRSSLLRTSLYNKNDGAVTEVLGTTRTSSPASGDMLLTVSRSQRVRDPLTGATLSIKGGHAQVTTPVQKQQMRFSKQFYVTKDVDITVQTLRNTCKVSKYTNEKIGTAGTPTGMESSLKAIAAPRTP